jgi:hypothetical protein
VEWTHLAQRKDVWLAVVCMVMNIIIHEKQLLYGLGDLRIINKQSEENRQLYFLHTHLNCSKIRNEMASMRKDTVRSGQVMSGHVISCHLMSSHVISCQVMSGHVMSCESTIAAGIQ